MSEPQVLPEAEPMSADGGPAGVLVLHGFTGNPSSMRGIAEACAAAGHAVGAAHVAHLGLHPGRQPALVGGQVRRRRGGRDPHQVEAQVAGRLLQLISFK